MTQTSSDMHTISSPQLNTLTPLLPKGVTKVNAGNDFAVQHVGVVGKTSITEGRAEQRNSEMASQFAQ